MITEITYHFGTVRIYKTYLVFVMNEGITVKPEYNDILLNISTKYYRNQNFGYITHRINSYSVDPRVYFETSKIENLVAFAVVSGSQNSNVLADFEKIFLKKPFEQFHSLDEAIDWVNTIVENTTV